MAEDDYIVLQNKIGFTVIQTYFFFLFETIKITSQYFSGLLIYVLLLWIYEVKNDSTTLNNDFRRIKRKVFSVAYIVGYIRL